MNREQQINQAIAQNSRCDCPELAELYKRRESLRALEAECQRFKERAGDLDSLGKADVPFLQTYKEIISKKNKAYEEFFAQIEQAHSEGYLSFIFSNGETRTSVAEKDTPKYSRNPNGILSANCSRCQTQVEVLS